MFIYIAVVEPLKYIYPTMLLYMFSSVMVVCTIMYVHMLVDTLSLVPVTQECYSCALSKLLKLKPVECVDMLKLLR